MKPVNYNDLDATELDNFTVYDPDGNEFEGFFTNARVDRDTLPEGKFAYDLREGDDGEMATIENSVTVNFNGTFITDSELPIPEDGCINIYEGNEDGWDYSF